VCVCVCVCVGAFIIYVVHIQSIKGRAACMMLILHPIIQARFSLVATCKYLEFHTHAKHETKFRECLYNSCHKRNVHN